MFKNKNTETKEKTESNLPTTENIAVISIGLFSSLLGGIVVEICDRGD